MKKLFTLISLTFFLPALNASAQFQFVSPLPGSKNLSPEHNIILREGHLIDAVSVRESIFNVQGTKSGNHDFKMILADDGKTILLSPSSPFDYDESVTVTISEGLKRTDGLSIKGFSFRFTTHREYDAAELQRFKDASVYLRNSERNENETPSSTPSEDTRDITGMFTITNIQIPPRQYFLYNF